MVVRGAVAASVTDTGGVGFEDGRDEDRLEVIWLWQQLWFESLPERPHVFLPSWLARERRRHSHGPRPCG